MIKLFRTNDSTVKKRYFSERNHVSLSHFSSQRSFTSFTNWSSFYFFYIISVFLKYILAIGYLLWMRHFFHIISVFLKTIITIAFQPLTIFSTFILITELNGVIMNGIFVHLFVQYYTKLCGVTTDFSVKTVFVIVWFTTVTHQNRLHRKSFQAISTVNWNHHC